MVYPVHYPNHCPPADATPAQQSVFRLVRQVPPTPTDFLSPHEKGIHPDADECLRCGLSVLESVDDAKRLRNQIPAFRTRRIVVRLLEPNDGSLKRTGSAQGHWTWWVTSACQPANLNWKEQV